MNIALLKQEVADWIEEHKQGFYEVADALWENPELGMEEYNSSKLLADLLQKLGFQVRLGAAGMPTSFIASWGQGKPVIGFSAEYDGLPGVSQDKNSGEKMPLKEDAPGHGCGHNLMGIGGIMAAAGLKEVMLRHEIPGTIRVFGTPAEELCMGKPFLAREGYFKELDVVLDWHPFICNRAGYSNSSSYFNIKYYFEGKTAHGNAPWHGRSALDGALLMGHALEMLREHMPPGKVDAESTLNYDFPGRGSGFPNVVPDKACIWIIGRFLTAEQAEDVIKRVDFCAEGAAIATGTKYRKEVITASHEKIPNKILSEVLLENFHRIGVPPFDEADNQMALEMQRCLGVKETGLGAPIEDIELRNMAVTDSSEYSWFAPTEVLMVQMAPPGIGWHNWVVTRMAGSEVGKKTVTTASKVLASTAVDLVALPELLSSSQEEWRERLKGKEYKPLFGEDVKPCLTVNKETMDRFR